MHETLVYIHHALCRCLQDAKSHTISIGTRSRKYTELFVYVYVYIVHTINYHVCDIWTVNVYCIHVHVHNTCIYACVYVAYSCIYSTCIHVHIPGIYLRALARSKNSASCVVFPTCSRWKSAIFSSRSTVCPGNSCSSETYPGLCFLGLKSPNSAVGRG